MVKRQAAATKKDQLRLLGGLIGAVCLAVPGAVSGDVVINEIHYNGEPNTVANEFVELHNTGSDAVSLAGWSFSDGIEFTFPSGTVLPAGGYVVVARNAAWLRPRYANLDETNTVGDYEGSLANGGERVALAMPEVTVATNNTVIQTNIEYVVVEPRPKFSAPCRSFTSCRTTVWTRRPGWRRCFGSWKRRGRNSCNRMGNS